MAIVAQVSGVVHRSFVYVCHVEICTLFMYIPSLQQPRVFCFCFELLILPAYASYRRVWI